ncbi:MAG: hypothetical protein AB7D06_13570 [Pedobacter sp.]
MDLWNSLYDRYKQDFNFIFFTPVESPSLKILNIVKLSYGKNLFIDLFDDCDFQYPDIVDKISEYDKIWQMYDPVRSRKVAYSWLLYWISILKLYTPSAVYIWNGFHLPEVALAQVAESSGIKRYFVERGPLAGTFSFDEMGINYRSSFVAHFEKIKSDIELQRIQRFSEHYISTGESNWGQPGRIASRAGFLNKFGIPKDKVILFFPSQVDKDSNSKIFSPLYPSVFDAYYHLVESLIPYSKDIFLLAKKHPMQEDAGSFKGLPMASGRWVEEAHIFDCIEHSDAVVSINSSSAVEAALLGKPVLILGQSILEKNRFVIKVENTSDLSKSLGSLIFLAKKNIPQKDDLFFSKLLFGYLFSPSYELNRIGVKGIGDIPFPQPSISEKNKFMYLDELSIISRFLALRPAQLHKADLSLKDWLTFARKIPKKILKKILHKQTKII